MGGNSKRANLGKNKKKILKIIVASTIGIASLSVGGYFIAKHFTDNPQQETDLKNIIDEINALNPNSTLLEINKANDDYNALSDADKSRIPEETKNHLIEQTNLYNKDAESASALKVEVEKLDCVHDTEEQLDAIVSQRDKLTKRGKTLLEAQTLTKIDKALEAYKNDLTITSNFERAAYSLSEKSTDAEITKVEEITKEVSKIQRQDLITRIETAVKSITQQRSAYSEDKSQVEKLKALADALVVDTSLDAQIKEAEDVLASAKLNAGQRGSDFTAQIEESDKKIAETRKDWIENKEIVSNILEEAFTILNERTAPFIKIVALEDYVKNGRIGEINKKRGADFGEDISKIAAILNAAHGEYEKDKAKVDDFANYVETLDGVSDTKKQIEDGFVLMQAAKDVKRTDLSKQFKTAKDKYDIAASNFENDKHDAEDIIEMISDVETKDDLVLTSEYVNKISSAYSDLKNERSKEIAEAESMAKWGKKISAVIEDLETALLEGSQLNTQLNHCSDNPGDYTTDEKKLQLLSIIACYDHLGVAAQKVVSLDNRDKIEIGRQLDFKTAYSFTELNGTGISKQDFYYGDFGYYVKARLKGESSDNLLTLDAAQIAAFKENYQKIRFYVEDATGDQILSITGVGSYPLTQSVFIPIEIQTADLPDSSVEFSVTSGGYCSITYLYGIK